MRVVPDITFQAVSQGQRIHTCAAGDWMRPPVEATPGRSLPTESGVSASAASQQTWIVASCAADHAVCNGRSLRSHPCSMHVDSITQLTCPNGVKTVVQVTCERWTRVASQLSPVQLNQHAGAIVRSAEHAVSWWHAHGFVHGAIGLDNVLQCGDVWKLGPPCLHLCSDAAADVRHLRAMASVLATECLVHRAGRVPVTPTYPVVGACSATGSTEVRVSRADALIRCEPEYAPAVGVGIPWCDIASYGQVLCRVRDGVPSSITCVPKEYVVFGAAVDGELAICGPAAPLPSRLHWGPLTLERQGQDLIVKLRWPGAPKCRQLRVRLRPDRYPSRERSGSWDSMEISIDVLRSAYEEQGRWTVLCPPSWNNVYVRIEWIGDGAAQGGEALLGMVGGSEPTSRGPTDSVLGKVPLMSKLWGRNQWR